MFFIGMVLISVKSFYKNYNNQQHDNMKNHYKWNNKNSRYTYFLCIYSFIIFYPYNYFMNFCPYILQEMIYICDFRGGKL